ncbi:hypothetical protein BDZ91DRAFT_851441 [Kalaharituber pfeilii]|nr:hypothetical protein BDZ91DRAFT_851441 [Kalaharituber pfeilii]
MSLAHKAHWEGYNSSLATIQPNSGQFINSVENGPFLTSDIQLELFGSYGLSINSHNNYEVVCFSNDGYGIAESILILGNEEHRPVDQHLH